ncbi:MAG: hypothetical protein HY720_05130 [Planctomycetes bacterium]|nr:hypothetical protein [Planctomycetota bacterium]
MKASRVFAVLLLVLAPAAWGQTQDEDVEKRARRLVLELGHEDWQVRQSAMEELRGLGELARGALEESREDPDLEVQARVQELLVALAVEPKKNLQRILASRLPEAIATKLAGAPRRIHAVSGRPIPLALFQRIMESIEGVPIKRPAGAATELGRLQVPAVAASLGEVLEGTFGPLGYVYLERGGELVVLPQEEVLRDPATMTLLLETLQAEDSGLARRALSLLATLTGKTFGLATWQDAATRAGTIEAWCRWYEENRERIAWSETLGRFEVRE